MALLTMLEAINLALQEEMARDERVVVLGQDVGRKGGVFGVTRGLQAQFGPLRVLDTPIAEVGIGGMAIGAALCGLRPVAEFQFADYLHPAFDQIANEAATISYRSNGAWRCPVVFRAPCGAGVHGGLYHSQSVEPNIRPARGRTARRGDSGQVGRSGDRAYDRDFGPVDRAERDRFELRYGLCRAG